MITSRFVLDCYRATKRTPESNGEFCGSVCRNSIVESTQLSRRQKRYRVSCNVRCLRGIGDLYSEYGKRMYAYIHQQLARDIATFPPFASLCNDHRHELCILSRRRPRIAGNFFPFLAAYSVRVLAYFVRRRNSTIRKLQSAD